MRTRFRCFVVCAISLLYCLEPETQLTSTVYEADSVHKEREHMMETSDDCSRC